MGSVEEEKGGNVPVVDSICNRTQPTTVGTEDLLTLRWDGNEGHGSKLPRTLRPGRF